MSDSTVQVIPDDDSTSSGTSATVQTESSVVVTSVGIQGIDGSLVPISENQEVDVVAEGLQNGSLLVYRTNTLKWTATRTLDAQNMEGGHY